MKKNKIVMLAIIIAIMIVIPSTYYFVFKENKSYSFYYIVEIQSFVTINSTVIVPMPEFFEDDEYWTNILFTESIQQGYMNTIVVNTDYGKGLMINASSNCRLNLTLTERVPAYSLSMFERFNPDGDVAIHNFYASYDNSTSLISLDIHFQNKELNGSEIQLWTGSSTHIFPCPIGWFEYPSVYYE